MAPTGACEAVLVREAEPEKFMAAFATAVAGEGDVFLGNPAWTDDELVRARQLMGMSSAAKADRGWLMIPTGGSSGQMKFARHDGHTIAAAVRGFARHFDLPQVNAVGVLPLYHVSGLMAWMRCVLTGGTYRAWTGKQLEAGDWPEVTADRPWVISLVPTQLDRLQRSGAALERLRQFRIIFLGGAPAWPELLERAAEARLPLSLSYG
ncbi:MAG: o-succinylbenzoate--CoA ligase, partial [Opitutus sp.]|nr:o-succinylbenzoate--CoA ligase [Opitutus sp.]